MKAIQVLIFMLLTILLKCNGIDVLECAVEQSGGLASTFVDKFKRNEDDAISYAKEKKEDISKLIRSCLYKY